MFAEKTQRPQDRDKQDSLLGAHSQIGETLRAFYGEIQEEEIPQKFLSLLEKLDKAERAAAPKNTVFAHSPALKSELSAAPAANKKAAGKKRAKGERQK